MQILWGNRLNVWANTSPTGMLGVFWLPVMPALLLVLGESQLASQIFAEPGFQNLAIASLAAVGTVAVLSAIASSRYARKAWLLPALSAVVVANAVVWGAVWLPQLGATWLHISQLPRERLLASNRRSDQPTRS